MTSTGPLLHKRCSLRLGLLALSCNGHTISTGMAATVQIMHQVASQQHRLLEVMTMLTVPWWLRNTSGKRQRQGRRAGRTPPPPPSKGGHVALLHWHQHLLRNDTADYIVSMMQYFREKIKAEAEGRPYTPPPPSKATSGAARPPARAA